MSDVDLGVPIRPEPYDIRGWQHLAKCHGLTDLFFPPAGGSNSGDIIAAKAVCAGCPVKWRCMYAGMEEKSGIWGGRGDGIRRRYRNPGGRRFLRVMAELEAASE